MGAASLSRAAELRPGFSEAPLKLAGALESLGREREASDLYRRLSRSAADPIDRRLFLARSLMLASAAAEAENEVRRAIAVSPDNLSAHGLNRSLTGA